MTWFGIFNGIATFWFFCAVWIYALKYHESATEVRFMTGSEITSLLSQDTWDLEVKNIKQRVSERRKKYCICNAVNIVLVFLTQILYIVSVALDCNCIESENMMSIVLFNVSIMI